MRYAQTDRHIFLQPSAGRRSKAKAILAMAVLLLTTIFFAAYSAQPGAAQTGQHEACAPQPAR